MGIRYNIDRYMSTHEDWRYLTQVLCDNQPYENSSSQMIIHNPSTTHNLNYYYNGQAGNWNIDFNADGYGALPKRYKTQRKSLTNTMKTISIP